MSKSIRTIILPTTSTTTELPNEWVDDFIAVGFTIDKEEDSKHAWWKDNMFGLYFNNNTVSIVRKSSPTTTLLNLTTNLPFTTEGIRFCYMPYYDGILFDFYGTTQSPLLGFGILEPKKAGQNYIAFQAGSYVHIGNNNSQNMANMAVFNAYTGNSPTDTVLLSKIWDTNDFRDDIFFTTVAPLGIINGNFRSQISGRDMFLMKRSGTANGSFFAIDMAGVPEDE